MNYREINAKRIMRKSIGFLCLTVFFTIATVVSVLSLPMGKKTITVVKEEEITIKGRVTDEKGNPVSGAKLITKDKHLSTKTDAAGVFELDKVPVKSILYVSGTGFLNQEFKVNKSNKYYRIELKSK